MNQTNEKRTIAYLCPQCGQSVIVTKDLFSLSAQPNQLPCVCQKTAVAIEVQGEAVQIDVPCHVCKETHRVSCPAASFSNEKLLSFACSGVNCCLIGEESAVFQATPRMEQEADMWASQGAEHGAFLNSHVMEEVLTEVREIASRGGISCVCGSTNWAFNVDFTTVELSCPSCGRATRIPASVSEDVENVCCCYTILIGGTGTQKGETS